MSFQIDPSVKKKISGRSDRDKVEKKLTEYSPRAQKRWVANPLLEYLLQSYMNGLTSGMVGSTHPTVTSSKSGETKKKEDAKKEDVKKDDESDEEGGMFDLFD